jgi:hypothetical protein
MRLKSMEKWEYLTIELKPKTEVKTEQVKKREVSEEVSYWDADYFSEQLNIYGQQGWELVSCFCTEEQVFGQLWSGGTSEIFAGFKRKLTA